MRFGRHTTCERGEVERHCGGETIDAQRQDGDNEEKSEQCPDLVHLYTSVSVGPEANHRWGAGRGALTMIEVQT